MLRSFCLLSLLAATGHAQSDPGSDPQFLHEFGRPGQHGSFRVKFDEQGAGVVWLQTMDHYVDAAAKDRAERAANDGGAGAIDPDDFLLLVWSGGDYSFRTGAGKGTASPFEQSLWSTRWNREVTDGAVRFWIESADGLRLTKTFRHRPDERGLALELQLENRGSAQPGTLPLELTGPALAEVSSVSLFGTAAWAIAQPKGGEARHVGPSADGAVQPLLQTDGSELEFVGSSNRFFGGFLFPLDEGASSAVYSVRVETLPSVAQPDLDIKAMSMPRTVLDVRLTIPSAGNSTRATFGVYLGPKSYRVFDESPEHARFLPIMDVDLEPPCCFGIVVPGGRFMASTLLKLLGFFHDSVALSSWGIAIMILTLLVRGCLAPLNFRMQRSMREYGKRMAVVKPKLDKLKEKYADDQKAMQQAMIQFQREHKLMPPLGGCLPIFLTMPIYIGLFTALRTAYDLRQERFLFMADLSAPDMLFLLPFWPHNFNIMPLLWIGLMVVLQSRMPLPTDPQQRQMQQIMRYMPIIFGVLLYNYASGLMVYMVTSMIWTFGETAVTKRILGPIDPNAAGMAPTPMM